MDENRFIIVCQQNMTTLYRIAYSIAGNRADAEDAVQQALLNAWKARATTRDGLERAWLIRIVINECYNLLRRRRCRPSESLETAVFPQENSDLYDAIRALPEKLRTPFLLKYMEGMQEKEVASTMKLPVSSVKNRLFRARKQLKKWLNEEVEM
ncbi:MAG: RNA polymerase sigma factor [Clostridia bacterium]|nr:RNA polymerase sigma factor [Clostridia bacterium]